MPLSYSPSLDSKSTFFTRRGEVVIPPEGAVVRPRAGIFALARSTNDAVLLVWPNFTNGVPDLPGGGIEKGETHDQAIEREWAEETGITFSPMGQPLKEFQHVRGFFAEQENEYWIYNQTFRLYDYNSSVTTGVKWRNPENDQASWERLEDLRNLPLNRAHWTGMLELMPELGK